MSETRLFTPGRIGPVELRNRTIRAAAFEGMSPGSRPSPALLDYHRSVAAGGVGMSTVAYVAVTNGGRSFEHQMWMRPEIVPGLRELTDAVHAEGAAAAVQLGHCGNMSDSKVSGERALAPSARFTLFGLTLPRAMTGRDIEQLIADFARAAALAREAGFDAVELHAGHGYLISQFLCPATNRRRDRWGGSLDNRARLARQVVARVLEAGEGQLGVVVKLNLRDGFEGGMELPEAIEVARMLEAEGAHALVLSGGFVSRCPMYVMRGEVPLEEMVRGERALHRKLGLALFGRTVVKAYPFSEAYFLEDALQVRAAVQLPLVLVGGVTRLETMRRAVDEHGFEFVAMARALFREPDLIGRLERGEAEASRCEPCNLCMASMYHSAATCPDREQERRGG